LLVPYNISIVENGYEFTTDYLLTYSVYFIDVTETFQSQVKVYSFGFGLVDHTGEIPPDERVGQTVTKILDNFFCLHEDIILYVPMESDGKEKKRLRLFDIWWAAYKKYFVCENLYKDRIEFKYESNKDFIVTIFFKESQREQAFEIYMDLSLKFGTNQSDSMTDPFPTSKNKSNPPTASSVNK
jgi:Family of unknown function (DUF6169)